jgi:hypothetical protein
MGMDVRAFILAKVARSTSRGLGMGSLPLLAVSCPPVGQHPLPVRRIGLQAFPLPPRALGDVGFSKFRVGAVAQMGEAADAVLGQEARRQVEVGA